MTNAAFELLDRQQGTLSNEEFLRHGIGWFGALLGILLILAIPHPTRQIVCSENSCLGGGSETFAASYGNVVLRSHSGFDLQPPRWTPWVDDPRTSGLFAVPDAAARNSVLSTLDVSACARRDVSALVPLLLEAPLPDGYSSKEQVTDLHACVLVSLQGVVAARLIGSSGSAATDRSILRMIRSGWRFEGEQDQPQWVRVRLDGGPRPPAPDLRSPID